MPTPNRSAIVALEEKWLNDQEGSNAQPLLRHLALRNRPLALTELARLLGSGGPPSAIFSAAGLKRRAYRLGDPTAAYNLAMDAFNARRMGAYRYWLRRAATAGDGDADRQFRRFETRLPHDLAHRIGRGRPYRSTD